MKDWIKLYLALLIAHFSWGQSPIVISIEQQEVVVNQPINVQIKSSVEGNIVENWPTEFTKGYGMQSYSSYVQDVTKGTMIEEHVVVFSGAFNQSGDYKIGPFYLKTATKTYESNTVKVTVLAKPKNPTHTTEITQKQLRQPAFGVVEVSSNKIYEGEPLVVSGRIYARERTFGRPVLRKPFVLNGIQDMHPLKQNEMWQTVEVKGQQFKSFAFEKKLYFPLGNQLIPIDPFVVILPFFNGNYKVESTIPMVEVIPLPTNPPNDFIGAVGTFEITQKCKTKQANQGDIVQLQVSIRGRGNLHAIETPPLNLPAGMSEYGDPEIHQNYSFTSEGAVGSIDFIYHIQLAKSGKQTIPPVQVSYFDPKKEKYVKITAPQSTCVKIQGNANLAKQTTQQKDNSGESNIQNFANKSNDGVSIQNWLIYGVGGIVLVGLLFFFLFKSKKEKPKEGLAKMTQTNVENTIPIGKTEVEKWIQKAEQANASQESEVFYQSLDKAILLLAKYQLKLKESDLTSRSELLEKLQEKHSALATTLNELQQQCNHARYGLGLEIQEQKNMLNKLKSCLV